MSANRFIRCRSCGMPHEADTTVCPVTGEPSVAERRRPSPPPPPRDLPYRWAHSVRPPAFDAISEVEATSMLGRHLGDRFWIDSLIGRGAIGAVYRAEDVSLDMHHPDRWVALKLLMRPNDDDSRIRFEREARIGGMLSHPNIIRVLGFEEDASGHRFQIMELLSGQSVGERIRSRGRLSTASVVEIARGVAKALVSVHALGVIHRDVKPDNVFRHRTPDGRLEIKLLDFGLAKVPESEASQTLTRAGVAVGTPQYWSPEQSRGLPDVDPRVDVWALGVTLYEALTGSLPRHDVPAAPSISMSDVPPLLDRVILRAMAEEPEDRWESAEEMLDALARVRVR